MGEAINKCLQRSSSFQANLEMNLTTNFVNSLLESRNTFVFRTHL